MGRNTGLESGNINKSSRKWAKKTCHTKESGYLHTQKRKGDSEGGTRGEQESLPG